MPDQQQINMAKYRIEKAKECIKDAEVLEESNGYVSAANRSYYAIFHAIRAVLALEGVDRKKHSAVISYFQQHYIKTGILDRKYSSILQNAFEVRQESDYEDFYVISKAELEEQLNHAKQFVAEVERYLSTIL